MTNSYIRFFTALLSLSRTFSVSGSAILPRNNNSTTSIPAALSPVPKNSSSGPTNPKVITTTISSDSTFQFQFLLLNGLATYRGADTNDVLKTALYVEPGNFESFAEAFYSLAEETKAKADATLANSNAVNARDSYSAAATYYRAADFYLHGDWSDPRIDQYWDLQTTCYNKALTALQYPAHRLTIKAADFDIPAIWYSPDSSNSSMKRPTIIIGEGYDAAQVRTPV